MWHYVSTMIQRCAGYQLANSRLQRSSSLVFSFPLNGPFRVIHANAYSVGVDQGFDKEKSNMKVLCGMTGFAVSEPLHSDKMKSSGFAKAIMKISLSHGLLPHTIIVDKDSKF
jgi:hypothetical protein